MHKFGHSTHCQELSLNRDKARAMITRYGMSKDFDMVALETVTNQYLGGDSSLACSAQTQREIDQKVVELVKAEHAKVRTSAPPASGSILRPVLYICSSRSPAC